MLLPFFSPFYFHIIHLFDLSKGAKIIDIYVNSNESEVIKHYFSRE